MRTLEPTELQIQASIVEWLNRCIRCRVAAIPNGTNTSIASAMKARKEGLSKGAPDLVVAYHDGAEARTVWIEVKAKRGYLSEEQQRWREDLLALGHDHLVARSLDDVIAFFGDA